MERAIAAIFIAIGLVAGGWFVGHGFYQGRAGVRYVEVKGVAERDVKADLAIWPIRYVEAGNDLGKVQAQIDADQGKVEAFLEAAGIAATNITVDHLSVTDMYAQRFQQSTTVRNRYIVAQTLMVRTPNVDLVEKASRGLSHLVEQGVVVSNEGYGSGGPHYLFTGLNRIKPQMIHQATVEARKAAEQFAKDSNSRLGGIRHADQGTFEILARDKAPGIQEDTQILKTVRVVSHLEFYLED